MKRNGCTCQLSTNHCTQWNREQQMNEIAEQNCNENRQCDRLCGTARHWRKLCTFVGVFDDWWTAAIHKQTVNCTCMKYDEWVKPSRVLRCVQWASIWSRFLQSDARCINHMQAGRSMHMQNAKAPHNCAVLASHIALSCTQRAEHTTNAEFGELFCAGNFMSISEMPEKSSTSFSPLIIARRTIADRADLSHSICSV